MTRAAWKGPFFRTFNLPKIDAATGKLLNAPANVEMQLRTSSRSCTILPSFVGHTFHVHNGKSYRPIKVTEDMIGHKLGEFAPTKKTAIFRADKKK